MRLYVLSDLHLEFADWTPPSVSADVVVIAGDLHKGSRGVPWIRRHFPHLPVVYIAGNHEFYSATVPDVLSSLRSGAGGQIYFLENEALELGDVVFLGCTLWTDLALHGDPVRSGRSVAAGLNDYRVIGSGEGFKPVTESDTTRFHLNSRRWLDGQFEKHRGRKCVVVTHHTPSILSLDPKFRPHPLAPGYASQLDKVVAASPAALWIHGHSHRSVDYRIGETRVVANQRGYPEQTQTGFRPEFVVEV
jgi:predicted phosphohydrolase